MTSRDPSSVAETANAPILLVHGLIGGLDKPLITSAFPAGRMLAPDLLGYGRWSDWTPKRWTLEDQADHLAETIRRIGAPVHVAGHSVGGAVALVLTHRHPELVASLTSIEGNFTLADAFWSSKAAVRDLREVDKELRLWRSNVAAWLADAGVAATPETVAVAEAWLHDQSAETIQAQSRAVVQATKHPDYLGQVDAVIGSGTPFHLVAGSRTRPGWNVPDWVLARATTYSEIPNAGHLMMLEAPQVFADRLLSNAAGAWRPAHA